MVTFENDGSVCILKIGSDSVSTVAQGTGPTWLNDHSIVYHDAGLVRQYDLAANKWNGFSIEPGVKLDPRKANVRAVASALVGEAPIYAQGPATVAKPGEQATVIFSQIEIDESGVHCYVVRVSGNARRKALVVSSMIDKVLSGGDVSAGMITALDLSHDERHAACAVYRSDSVNQAGVATELWVVGFDDAQVDAGFGPRLITTIDAINDVHYLDNESLLVSRVDQDSTLVPVPGMNASYRVGLVQLAEEDLVLMGLDPSIAKADVVLEVDIGSGESWPFLEGHSLTYR